VLTEPKLHEADLEAGYGEVYLPDALLPGKTYGLTATFTGFSMRFFPGAEWRALLQ
jgi:hypothetical protein